MALRRNNIKLINDVKDLGFTVNQLADRFNASTADFVTSKKSLTYRPSIPDSIVTGLEKLLAGDTTATRISPRATKAGREQRKKSKPRSKRFTRYMATYRCKIEYDVDKKPRRHMFYFVKDGRTKNVRDRAETLHGKIYPEHMNVKLISVRKK